MAAFEWAQGLVFDAAGEDALDMQSFSRIPAEEWAGLTFDFTPAMQRLDLSWNIPELWSALNDGEEPVPELRKGSIPSAWLLWRQDLSPGWRRLDVDEAWAMDRAMEGMNFGDICEGLLEWVDESNAPLRAAGFLRTWVSHGLLIDVFQGNCHDGFRPGAIPRACRRQSSSGSDFPGLRMLFGSNWRLMSRISRRLTGSSSCLM